MTKKGRRQITCRRTEDKLDELQRALVHLQDDLSETMAWTALLCDGLCGILAENQADIDATTHSGARFATSWLKQRNERHAADLQAARVKLQGLRGK